ncbi:MULTISPECIES: FkbM family methyltransferase [unclassified Clostridioides]|uniref:FkbM family methyltransferase n=1 Tax=unclassified Clostridioides TaxID=2635829 RepID=UPI001D101001|nr:FkbM family methyltransferase [Clostridioides sp. ES-S-0171-01]MCC0688036.1 FkbM family methyltransferase [Clostridioides sp. ES-S-0056-01]MCC0715251.1 FkbM family methyltransferase [Clostridioides sp. ES-S-0077-01]UDN54951.1 FkbM family methyltransferase [Clostridioides sp. ES-S-0054-01]
MLDILENLNNIDLIVNELLNHKHYNNDLEHTLNKSEIILYGAGNLGNMASEVLSSINITPRYIVDKNIDLHGKKINGINIINPDYLSREDKENSIFAICIVKIQYNEIKEYLEEIGCKNICHFYDITEMLKDKVGVSNGWILEDLSEVEKKKISKIYNKFEDIESKLYYIQWLCWRICKKEIKFKNLDINTENKFFIDEIMSVLNENEVYIDCGAYTGNTLSQFIEKVNGKFNKIIAFEPNLESYQNLQEITRDLNTIYNNKINIFKYGVGETKYIGLLRNNLGLASKFVNLASENFQEEVEIVNLDEFLINLDPTFIKVHVEGMELDVLKGSMEIICKMRPILVITTYHNSDGVYKIPDLLINNLNDYSFYFRLHGYCGTQSVLYAIPNERKK